MASPKNGNTYIYALSDPRTLEIRYIGQTIYPLNKRLNEHVCKSSRNNYHVSNWIAKLLTANVKPVIEIVEENPKNLQESEVLWIAQFRAWGYRLVNHTIGGEGCKGNFWSDKAKINAYKNKGGRPFVDNLGNRYESPGEASRQIKGTTASAIRCVLKGKYLTASGRTFWFLGDAPKELPTEQSRREKRIGKDKRSKPFCDQYGASYRSVRDASNKCNIHKSDVLAVLKGRYKQAKGFVFTYMEKI